MKRRILIFLAAAALYGALMSVTWTIGTARAVKATESLLDFGFLNLHDTLAGAIDTMLGHVARTAVRHLGEANELSLDEMGTVALELDIDEVNAVTREGRIIASNDPHCLGVIMAGDPVMEPFMELTNGVTATVSQPFRAHARNPKVRAKYLAAAFPGGNGFVQVGLDEGRLSRMLPSILGYIFDEWLLGKTGFFLCADGVTNRLISNPSRHRDEARTLAESGYRIKDAAPYEIVLDGKSTGETFEQELFGEKCYCRASVFAGHRFVAAVPQREYYGTRNVYMGVLAVLLFVVIGAFALFVDRIWRDSDRLKSFYAAEEKRRAKDLAIAKNIQTSALSITMPASPSFSVVASMQAAREVGGDFYDYFFIDSSHVAFLVADVSGKGITAALYMMTAKTLIKDMLFASGGDPAKALTKVNEELARSNSANMFLTAWAGVLDLETGIVTFANAGHNLPFVVSGKRAPVPLTTVSGPVLAFMDGVVYRPGAVQLELGDAIFLYTDGVTEALDVKKRLFGDERLLDALKVVKEPDPHALSNVVRMAVAAFTEGAPQADDITVLALRYISSPKIATRSFLPTQAGVMEASSFLDEVMGPASNLTAMAHVVLDEMCSNIVKHSGASVFEVDVNLTSAPRSVTLTFVDDGVAYNPLSHLDPDVSAPVEARAIGGLGIMMVKNMAESVSYHRERNRNFFMVVLSSSVPCAK